MGERELAKTLLDAIKSNNDPETIKNSYYMYRSHLKHKRIFNSQCDSALESEVEKNYRKWEKREQ